MCSYIAKSLFPAWWEGDKSSDKPALLLTSGLLSWLLSLSACLFGLRAWQKFEILVQTLTSHLEVFPKYAVTLLVIFTSLLFVHIYLLWVLFLVCSKHLCLYFFLTSSFWLWVVHILRHFKIDIRFEQAK